jgi:3-methyladenine DNA glycosylase AlkC
VNTNQPSKSPRKPSDVLPEVVAALNAGTRETANLAEGLALDDAALLRNVFPELAGQSNTLVGVTGVTKRMAAVGVLLHQHYGMDGYAAAREHSSDTVRGWAAYLLAASDLELRDLLERARPLADDPHFGVREWVWLALRPQIAAEIERTISLLTPWTAEASPYLRRFTVESTRPRGVWSAHIPSLKERPELGLPLLEPLRSESARYVQDSVANWLNDAAKTRPDWVRDLCSRWRTESPTPQTLRICKRASRSLP